MSEGMIIKDNGFAMTFSHWDDRYRASLSFRGDHIFSVNEASPHEAASKMEEYLASLDFQVKGFLESADIMKDRSMWPPYRNTKDLGESNLN